MAIEKYKYRSIFICKLYKNLKNLNNVLILKRLECFFSSLFFRGE